MFAALPQDSPSRRYGPLAASFIVYNDLFAGTSKLVDGIYEPNTDAGVDGGHAITLVGWGLGETSKKPYWLVRNSWGPAWNGDGYFRILRGSNACSIESCAVSVRAGDVDKGVAPITGSVTVSSLLSALTNNSTLSKTQKVGIAVGASIGGILFIALVIALVIYTRDKGFAWTKRSSPI